MIHFFPVLKIMLLEVNVLNFMSVVAYLKDNLPYDVAVVKHAQYLHPEKRDFPGSLSAISNL